MKKKFRKISRRTYEGRSYTSLTRTLEKCRSAIKDCECRLAMAKEKYESMQNEYKDALERRASCITAEVEEINRLESELKNFGIIKSILNSQDKARIESRLNHLYGERNRKWNSVHIPTMPDISGAELSKVRRRNEYIISLIEPIIIKAKEKYDSEMRVRALASAYMGKSRNLAAEVKGQLEVYGQCPYCRGSIGEYPQADHILPVSTGGLSTFDNMVYVCAGCNNKKSDMTLREFCIKYNLNREEIEFTLVTLGKRV